MPKPGFSSLITDRCRYVSPRKRAQRTLELLGIGSKYKLPWKEQREGEEIRCDATIEVTESIREWDYGDYEGLTSATISQKRKEEGLSPNWDIWSEGCPGGEYGTPRAVILVV